MAETNIECGPDEDGGCRTCGCSWEGEKNADGHHECPPGFGGRIHWAIIGGESDPRKDGARPCDLAWIRALVERCRAAGVAPFVKQLGSAPFDSRYKIPVFQADTSGPVVLKHKKGGDPSEWPEEFPREFPEVPRAA